MGQNLKMKVSASLVAIANAGSINMFGAQRTTEMNTPENPFCINCSDATLGQFPWQLSLQTTGHFCGGSILSATPSPPLLIAENHHTMQSLVRLITNPDKRSKPTFSLVIHNTTDLRSLMISPSERSPPHSLSTTMPNQFHWLTHQALDQLMAIHSRLQVTDTIKWAPTEDQFLKSLAT